jgi:cytochrome c
MTFWSRRRIRRLAITLTVLLAACGGKGESGEEAEEAEEAQEHAEELSAFELEHGIGPVKEPVTLGPVDPALAATGKGIFEQKCSACHKMESKYVGPALGEVTARRSPAFIMNMILNPMEMVERHPVGKQLLAEHMTFMANQNLTQDDARAVLEYLRTQAQGQPKN